MRARKAQQAAHWARKRASPGKLRNPDEDRIVLIEDTAEIHLEKPNLVRFEARQAQVDLPAITTRDLRLSQERQIHHAGREYQTWTVTRLVGT